MTRESLRVLVGWKEIAAYLECSMSTAARRVSDGLPVFRVGGSVRAFAEDIDRWMEGERIRKVEERVEGEEEVRASCVVVEGGELVDTATALARESKTRRYALISLGVDTTELEQYERRLASAEDKYRWLVETVPVWIWETNATGQYVYSNVAVLDILGYRPEEIEGFTPEEFLVAAEETEQYRRRIGELRARKKLIRDFQCRFNHREGEERWLETDAEPVFNAEGRFTGIRGVSRDITERWLAEARAQSHFLDLAFLRRTAMDFVGFPREGDLFAYLAAEIVELAGEVGVALALYDEREDVFRIRSITGMGDRLAAAAEYLGGDPRTVSFRTSAKTKARLLTGKLQRVTGALDELTAGAITKRQGRKLKKALHLGEIHAFGLTRHRILWGAVAILLPAGAELLNRPVVEAFLNQAGVALQRKMAEEALFRAAEEWRRTFDAVPETVFLIDPTHNIVRANRAAAERFRRNWPDLLNRKCYRVIHGRDKPDDDCPLHRLFATAEEQPRGEVYSPVCEAYFDFTYSPIKDDTGQAVGAVLVGRDVTERKRAEEIAQLQRDLALALAEPLELQAALRLCLDAALRAGGTDAGGIYLVDEATGALDLAYAEGLGPAFAASRAHFDADSPNARLIGAGEAVYSARDGSGIPLREDRRTEGLRAVAVLPVKHKGRVVACLIVASRRSDEFDAHARAALEAIAAQIGGVIARLRAESALQESQQNLQGLFDTVEDLVFVLDAEGHVQKVNAAVQARLGYSEEELAGRPVTNVHPPQRREEAETVMIEILAGRRSSCDIPVRAKTGKEIPVEMEVSAGRWGGQEVFFGVARDVTERKRAEAERERERKAFRIIAEASVEGENIPGLCRQILEGLAEALGFDFGAVRLLDPDSKTLTLAATSGLTRREAMDLPGRLKVDEEGNWGAYVARTGRAVFSPEVDDSPAEGVEGKWWAAMGIRALIAWPVYGAAGNLLGVVQLAARTPKEIAGGDQVFFATVAGMFATVLERRQAEEALERSEAKHRLLLESIRSPVLALDREMNILYYNDAYAELVGRPREELEGKNLPELVSSIVETELYKTYAAALATGTPQEAEGELGERYLRTAVYPMPWGILTIATDITQRKRAEEALRESEEKFRNLAEQSPNMIFINSGGKVVYANKRCEETMGYTREEFYAPDFDFLALIAPGSQGVVREAFAAHSRGEDIETYEYALVGKEGRQIDVITTAKLITYEGEPAVLGIVTDVTERKRAEEALRESELEFRLLFENARDAIFWVDPETESILRCNRAAEALAGKAEAELVGQHFSTLHPTEKTPGHQEIFEQYRRTGSPREIETKVLKPSGEVREVIISASSTTVGGKEIIQGIFHDVTERRRAEEALRESEELYRTSIETSPDAIALTDLEGKIIMFNQQALVLHGLEKTEDLEGKNAFDFVAPADRPRAIANMRETLAGGLTRGEEFDLVKGDGTRFPAEISVSLLKDADGKARGYIGVLRDITERKQAEGALQASERKFRELFEGSPAAVTIVSPTGIVLAANKATEELTGYAWEELREKYFADLLTLTPKDLPVLKDRFEALLGGDAGDPYDLEIIRKDGSKRWIRVRNSLLQEGEEFAGIQVISVDVTERKQAQEALRVSEEKFRSIFDRANIGMCLVDLDGRLLQVNDQMTEIFGYSREEMEGRSVNDFTHPDYLEVSPRFIERSVAGDVERAEFEKKYYHCDGHVVWGLISSSLIRDAEGNPRYFISHVQDITQRRRVEEAVRESEERYRNLVETSADSIIFANLDGTVATVNPPGAALLGLDDPEEVVGRNILEFVARAEEREAAGADVQKLLKEGTLTNVSYDLRRKDGSIFPSESSGSVVRNAAGKAVGFIAVTRDVSARKRAEEALRESEGLYRNLVEMSADAISFSDLGGNVVAINRRGAALLGFDDPEEIVGRNVLEFVAYAEEHAAAAADLQRVVAEGTLTDISYAHRRKDGSVFPTEANATVVRDGDGNPIGFIAVTRDITKRKRAEEALRASEELYRGLFEKSPATVAVLDSSGVITECNAAAEGLTGYGKEDIVGKRFDKLASIKPKDRRRLRGFFEKALAGEPVEPYDLEIVTKAGGRRQLQVINASFTRQDGSPGIQVLAYDVTGDGPPS